MCLLRKAIFFFSQSSMLYFDSLKDFVRRWDINFFNKRQNSYNESKYNIKELEKNKIAFLKKHIGNK